MHNVVAGVVVFLVFAVVVFVAVGCSYVAVVAVFCCCFVVVVFVAVGFSYVHIYIYLHMYSVRLPRRSLLELWPSWE